MTSLTELASKVLANAITLDAYSASQGQPSTSFETHTLENLPPHVESARKALINACQSLKQLGNGPIGQIYDICFNFTDSLSLRFIYEQRLADHVPDDGDISFAAIAKAANSDEMLVRRCIQHAMINNIFQEKRPGFVSHSASSRLIKQQQGMRDTIGFLLYDIAPGALHVTEAMRKWPGSAEPNETGFNIVESTALPFYERLAEDADRSRRFGGGMRYMTQGSLYDIRHLINGYDWATIDSSGCTFVDVGGSHGQVCQALAGATSNLRFVVQDLEGTVKAGAEMLPAEFKDRIAFQPHDFFRKQPVQGADVYFFRFILHNWADKYAIQILRNLLPAMKPGSRIIIYEFLPDTVADVAWTSKQKRNLDMIQAIGWNSLERTEPDWNRLFQTVDGRLKFLGCRTPIGSAVSFIEAEFSPDTNGVARTMTSSE